MGENREQGQFRTERGYLRKCEQQLTSGMEDYLEMLFRIESQKGYTRLNDLSSCLDVQPSSATRMVQRLAEQSFVNYEPYGVLHLTDKGRRTGSALLGRHNLLERFLNLLGVKDNRLKDTERIEHTISAELVERIHLFVIYASENPKWVAKFQSWAESKPY